MTQKLDYRIPAVIMAVMLLCIIYLVVIYPAMSYKLDRPDINPNLNSETSDWKLRKDYTDLEWYGRTVYMQEGCWYCHSQQPRYQDRGMGPTGIPQEYQYDAPHLLGSERTGPDLSREGGKYPTRWHREHHINPRSKSAGSIMPSFKHLDEEPLVFDEPVEGDVRDLLRKTPAELRKLYNSDTDRKLTAAETIVELRAVGYNDYDLIKADGRGITRLDALDAYIQSLGPNRMYEPGGAVPMYEAVQMPQDDQFKLGKDGVHPPTNWHKLAEERATYWVPTEYQDLARKAKEDNKIPAFEPRFIVNGRGIYLEKCVSCHGPNGQGNGPAGRYMMVKPANFWLPQYKLYSDAMWFYRIAEGVPGTEMPVWKLALKQRKENQKWDQIWYLVTWLKYVAAASPIPEVPYDLPADFYMRDLDRERQAIFPVDPEVIQRRAAELEAQQKQAAAGGKEAGK